MHQMPHEVNFISLFNNSFIWEQLGSYYKLKTAASDTNVIKWSILRSCSMPDIDRSAANHSREACFDDYIT